MAYFRELYVDYTLTVRDLVCPNTIDLDTISVNLSPAINFSPDRNFLLYENCSGSDLTLITNRVDSLAGLSFLSITTENGCTTTQTIFINDLRDGVNRPEISASIEDCNFDQLLLEVPEFNGTNVIYNWLNGDGILLSTTTSHQEIINNPIAGTIYLVSINDGDCVVVSDSIQPIIEQTLSVTIDTNTTVACSDGFEDLTLNATITGGSAPYDITWTGVNGFQSFNEDPTLINATNELSGTY